MPQLNLTPEELNKILSMGSADERLAVATRLRNQPSPEGRNVSGGRMYVAGSPLEHLATTAGRIKGGRDAERIQREQTQGRQALLKADPEQIAMLAMLSGDEQMARFGEVLLDNEQRKAVLQQREAALQGRLSQPVHLGEGFIYDPVTGKATQDPAYADFMQKQYDQRLELLRTQQGIQSQKVTGTERAKLADMDSKLQLGRDALAQLGENPDAVEPYADAATNVVKGFFPDMGNIIEGAHKSPAELDTLNKMRRFIAGIRKSELGSALTGYELTKGTEWDPTAGGITTEESARRLKNLLTYLEQEFQTLRAGRPLPSPSSPATVQPKDAPPPSPEKQSDQVWGIDENGKPVRLE